MDKILTRLESAGICLKRDKCAFLLPAVEYLGYTISGYDLQLTDEKVQAIKNAPAPHNVTQLKSFLGLVNYYSKFLLNLSNTLAPSTDYFRKTQGGVGGLSTRRHSKKLKSLECVMVHFDPTKPLILPCDASPYGVGAVLSHRMENAKDQPIVFHCTP